MSDGIIAYLRKLFLILFAASCAGISLIWAEILDPEGSSPDAALLRSIAEPLHDRRIDVILGTASAFPAPTRPRLASLTGFKVDKQYWSVQPKRGWTLGFQNGIIGALVAVKPPSISKKKEDCDARHELDPEGCRFVADWLDAEPDERIFVAFTRSDAALAVSVKDVLERMGYVVFIYLKDKASTPWADPTLVGEAFAQAAHRLVIDTSNSRGSEGVAAEQKICEIDIFSAVEARHHDERRTITELAGIRPGTTSAAFSQLSHPESATTTSPTPDTLLARGTKTGHSGLAIYYRSVGSGEALACSGPVAS
jgi:hypothetical protein